MLLVFLLLQFCLIFYESAVLGWEIFRTLLKVFGASSFSRSFKLSMNQIRWMIIIWMQNFDCFRWIVFLLELKSHCQWIATSHIVWFPDQVRWGTWLHNDTEKSIPNKFNNCFLVRLILAVVENSLLLVAALEAHEKTSGNGRASLPARLQVSGRWPASSPAPPGAGNLHVHSDGFKKYFSC